MVIPYSKGVLQYKKNIEGKYGVEILLRDLYEDEDGIYTTHNINPLYFYRYDLSIIQDELPCSIRHAKNTYAFNATWKKFKSILQKFIWKQISIRMSDDVRRLYFYYHVDSYILKGFIGFHKELVQFFDSYPGFPPSVMYDNWIFGGKDSPPLADMIRTKKPVDILLKNGYGDLLIFMKKFHRNYLQGVVNHDLPPISNVHCFDVYIYSKLGGLLHSYLNKMAKRPGDVYNFFKNNKGRYKKLSTYLNRFKYQWYDTARFLHEQNIKPVTFQKFLKIDKRYHDIIHILRAKASQIHNQEVSEHKILDNVPEGYRQLITQEEFLSEGTTMKHCVGGYYNSFLLGDCFIFHVSNNNNESTCEVYYHEADKKFKVRQNQAVGNTTAKTSTTKLINWLNENKSLTLPALQYKIENTVGQAVYEEVDINKYFIRPFKLKMKEGEK